jgi:soluble lytic murein transglycosylase
VAGDADAEALALFAALDRDRADCRPVLTYLRSKRLLTPARVQARIDAAIVANQTGLAQVLSNDLPKARQDAAKRSILARAEPSVALNQAGKWPANADSAHAAAIALAQSARKSALAAQTRYQTLARTLPFAAADRLHVEAEIARYAAVERLPEAAALLQALPPEGFDDNLREWQVRYHLRRLEWAAALDALDGMDPVQAAPAHWTYTRGRVLELLQRPEEAKLAFAAAAGEANFHGFLAADRIGAAYAICPDDGLINAERALAVLDLGGIRRALEWAALGDIDRARSEWFWQLPQLTPEQRREAGLIASREGQHEWAIFTLNTDTLLRQYQARFPLLHSKAVEQEAKRTGLPEHWVYGLIRAESAWNSNARSPVGARGLMQLMPGTAAAVAKSLGVRASPLTDADHNIRLGTTYLALRFSDLDSNALLATGAYNAGIGAVKRWIGEPLPPWDLWVETVPYKETREYIARVMAFAVLYDWRIDGSPMRLSAMIPGMNQHPGLAPVQCANPGEKLSAR